MDLTTYQTKLNKSIGKLESLEYRKKIIEDNLSILVKRQQALEEAQAFIQLIAKETQEQLKYNISDIVNLALDTCFPGEYKFDVIFEIKRGRTEARLVFLKNGIEIDPMTASGGGVVDLVSFALRISAWSLGNTDNIIILDEPFRFLSKDLQSRAGEIMKRLSEKLKIQLVISTHIQDIINYADKVFELKKINDVSKVVVKE